MPDNKGVIRIPQADTALPNETVKEANIASTVITDQLIHDGVNPIADGIWASMTERERLKYNSGVKKIIDDEKKETEKKAGEE